MAHDRVPGIVPGRTGGNGVGDNIPTCPVPEQVHGMLPPAAPARRLRPDAAVALSDQAAIALAYRPSAPLEDDLAREPGSMEVMSIATGSLAGNDSSSASSSSFDW